MATQLPPTHANGRVCNAVHSAVVLGTWVLVAGWANHNIHAGTLVSQGQAGGSIIYQTGSTFRVTSAINDLQSYVQQMSGATLPVLSDPGGSPGGFNIRIGSTGAAPVNPASITDEQVGLDGFIIQSVPDGVVISGRTPDGTANGIYYFAEKMLGIQWLSPEESGPTIKPQSTIQIGAQNVVNKPDARWRGQYYSFQQHPGYQTSGAFNQGINANRDRWWTFNRVNSPSNFQVESGHSFSTIVPDSLFATHPEYFPLINYTYGPSSNHLDPYENRIPNGNPQRRADDYTFQRELGNPDVLQMAIDYTRAQFAANPNLKYVSLSANDGPWWSNSPESQALGPTDSARNLAFVNAVAEANEDLYPDRGYMFYAYESTLEPPAGMTVHPNVVPMIAPLRTGRVHSILSAHPDSVYERGIVEGWAAISDRIAWHPYMNGGPLTTPGVITMAEQAKYYRDQGSMGGFREHANLPSVGWAMANWVEVQLMWDADQDPVDLRQRFVDGYYGSIAAPVVDKIYGDIETRMRNTYVAGDPNAQVEDPSYLRPLIAPSAGAIAVALRASSAQPDLYKNRLTRDMWVLAELAAPTVFSDNFNNKTGSLTGKAANTGQTWEAFTFFGSYSSFTVSTAHGLHGSRGAGTSSSSSFRGNSASLGTTITDGLVQVEMDLQTQASGRTDSTLPLKQWWLRDTISGNFVSIYWESDGDVGFEGLGLTTAPTPSGMSLNGSMHVALNIDLDLKSILFSWFDNDDPTDPATSGSLNIGTYAAGFAPNRLDIWGRGESNIINSGYDNIEIRTVSLTLPLGDADLDGDVDLSDLSALASSYGQSAQATWVDGDFDFDGDVDLSDLSVLAAQYGAGSAQAFADFQSLVPEPSALAWAGLASLTAVRRRSVIADDFERGD